MESRSQVRAARTWTAHDEAMRSFYAAFVEPGDLVFDVGANVGNRTKIFVRLGARVVAVEPQPACAAVLARAFRGNRSVTIAEEAVGATAGSAEMKVSDAPTISSMSTEWIDAVRSSGRFASHRWGRTITVRVATLDGLIARHGVPAFIKVDVEGFEREVMMGLSRAVGALSFEFTPEFAEPGFACLARLEEVGFRGFNYSAGEAMSLDMPRWVGAGELRRRLEALRGDSVAFGDVYACLSAGGPR